MNGEGEIGWAPDFIYIDGKFEAGMAMFATDGVITRLSRAPEDLRKARKLGNRAILPGLVNVHSHSFQRTIRGRTEHRTSADRDTFWTWREAMYSAANRLTPEDVYHVARMAFLEMLLSGVTTVGEFHYLHNAPDASRYENPNLLALEVVRAATEVGLRIALLRTAYARAGWKQRANPGQARFITTDAETFISDTEALRASVPASAWVGVAPHSVRALPLEYVVLISEYARSNGLCVHMHVAEQPGEIAQCLAEHGCRPVQLLESRGILKDDFTGIHAIHITEEEAGYLGEARSHVCACPTSERNLGDGAVPADKLAAAGARMCFGSDSNVQIDLLEDARELEYHLRMEKLERAVLASSPQRAALAARLFDAATVGGAEALKGPSGSLEVGKPADFFTVDLADPSIAGAEHESLLTNIVFSGERTAMRDVYIGGKQIIEDGEHHLQNEIVRDFAQVQQRLWG